MAELVQNLGSFVPDNLIVDGSIPVLTKAVKLDAGQGILQRGTVLGKITKAIGEIVGPDTAKGTISEVALGKAAKLGTYTLTCITATDTSEGGGGSGDDENGNEAILEDSKNDSSTTEGESVPAVFKVVDPDGIRLDDATADEEYVGPINFTITEGTSGFALDDEFSISVVAGDGQYKVVNSANVDGSQDADCILADDVNTAEGSVVAVAYTSGHFNRKALIFGGKDTADMHEAKLRELGIFLSDNVSY